MKSKKSSQATLSKRLYSIKDRQSGLSLLFFWELNKNFLYIMRELQQIKYDASEDKDILSECGNLEMGIRKSFIYSLKKEKIDGILRIESGSSLEDKLHEISTYTSESINTEEKLKQSQEYLRQSSYLAYAFRIDKQKNSLREIKKIKKELEKGINYWNFLVKSNKGLDEIMARCFEMNRKTDFYVENKISHYFRMKKLGDYLKIIKNDSLKYSDQVRNPDLADKIMLKNNGLENLSGKIATKINGIKLLLDEELRDIGEYFEDKKKMYPEWFLKKQKQRLSILKWKYKALSLDCPAKISENLVVNINFQLTYIKKQKRSDKINANYLSPSGNYP